MKSAHCIVLDRDGDIVWRGSVLRLFRDNCFSLAEAREHVDGLRAAFAAGDAYRVGGGAAEVFDIELEAS